MAELIKKIAGNKIFVYLGSRYATYALQFVVSIFIASRLGPYYLGIYGFISLILNYLGQLNFGVPHSLNVLLVHNKDDKYRCDQLIGNSLIIYSVVGIVFLVAYGVIEIFEIKLSDKYPIEGYLFFIVITAILTYYNYVMTMVLRFRNKVNQLAIAQSINVVLQLLVVFLFEKEELVLALVICLLASSIFTIILASISKVLPSIRSIVPSKQLIHSLLSKGFYLFLYNSCFFFILLSIRTIISANYSVEDFGLFTFSFTMANAALLLMESLMSIVFPKVIDLLSTKDYTQIKMIIEKIRVAFISSSHFVIYIAMALFPLLIIFMPKYEGSVTSLNLVALAILMNTNSYGYSTLLISQNKEKISAIISVISLILNIALALILTNVIKVGFSYVILATLLTYLYLSFATVWEGNKIMGIRELKESIRNFFPVRLLVPYMIALLISILELEYLIWIPLVVYCTVNFNDLKELLNMARKLANNPNIADV